MNIQYIKYTSMIKKLSFSSTLYKFLLENVRIVFSYVIQIIQSRTMFFPKPIFIYLLFQIYVSILTLFLHCNIKCI